MDFTEALEAKDVARRDELIREEIEAYSWDGELEDLPRGGWPEDTEVSNVTIKEDGDALLASVVISFTEYVPSGCKDHPTPYDRTAHFTVGISKADGTYVVEEEYSYDDDEDELYVGDYL